jgi:hypothetical protein
VEVLGVGTCDLGRDISDTESSGHGKVRDHGTGEDHGGKPASLALIDVSKQPA